MNILIKSMAVDEIGISEAQWNHHQTNTPSSPLIVSVPKHKSRLALYPTTRNLMALLDICKVADIVLFVIDAEEVIDSYGAALLSALMAQGLPTVFGAIVGLENVSPKARSEVRKSALKTFQQKFTTEPRVIAMEGASDVSNLVRFLSVSHVREFWRNQRAYMLPVGVHYTPDEGSDFGTLHLTGHIRGQNFDPNNLVHLTGIGDFQVVSVESAQDPYYYDKRGPSAYTEALTLEDRLPTLEPHLLLPTPELQETLVSVNAVNDMENEQTWPTKYDMLHADELKARKKIMVPKGMGSYAGRWLQFSDDEEGGEEDGEEEEDDEENDGGMDMDDGQGGQEPEEEFEDEDEEMEEIDDEQTALIKKLEAQAEEMRLQRAAEIENDPRKRANPDLEFNDDELEMDFDYPDEVDVPEGSLAQDIFRDYRGLKSFRTTPWDPYENLPRDYHQIFRFPNFDGTKKKVLALAALSSDELVVPKGSFVTIHLKDVHKDVMSQINPETPLIASSLLIFEGQFSVMHYAVTKQLNYEGIIKTAEPLLFHVGFRRFSGSALFTEDTRGSTKYKMEKILHPDRGSIATVFAPVTFPNQPVMLWKLDEHQVPHLCASGSVRTCDPNRIIVKKIVLTGHPMTVEKTRVIVSGMFHHPDDVRYYKKAELYTKGNVRGQIKEPLGTKGLFKAVFGDRITNADTVCLSLYKRVYPNWLDVPQPPRPEGTLTVAPVAEQNTDDMAL